MSYNQREKLHQYPVDGGKKRWICVCGDSHSSGTWVSKGLKNWRSLYIPGYMLISSKQWYKLPGHSSSPMLKTTTTKTRIRSKAEGFPPWVWPHPSTIYHGNQLSSFCVANKNATEDITSICRGSNQVSQCAPRHRVRSQEVKIKLSLRNESKAAIWDCRSQSVASRENLDTRLCSVQSNVLKPPTCQG